MLISEYPLSCSTKTRTKQIKQKIAKLRKEKQNIIQALDILTQGISEYESFDLTLGLTHNKYFNPEFTYLQKTLGWNENQCLIMAVQLSTEDLSCHYNTFQNAFKISNLRLRQFKHEFDSLIEQGYIFNGNSERTFFVTNKDALDCLTNNIAFEYKDYSQEPIDEVLYYLHTNVFNGSNDTKSCKMWYNYVKRRYQGHKLFERIKNVFEIHSGLVSEETIEIILCSIITNQFYQLYPSFSIEYQSNYVARTMSARKVILDILQSSIESQKKDLVLKTPILENQLENGLATPNTFVLSREGMKYFGISDIINIKNNFIAPKNIKQYQTIRQKKLYYDEDTQEQIDRMFAFMSESNFNKIQKRLQNSGLRIGFNILLYGSAGTGKTETCLQLSRTTKRDLFVVEVNNIKDKYVGESEKKLKEVFVQYDEMVSEYKRQNKRIPIMLLNEADAIFGLRKKGAEDAVDKMENSIQNILLNEMENINGILIATTNLTENFDSAFERRFLYKIKYSNPSEETMFHIWKSNKLGLKEEEIRKLTVKYSLSGGEIENIVRKTTIEQILNGGTINFDMVCKFADCEKLNKTDSKKVGFSI